MFDSSPVSIETFPASGVGKLDQMDINLTSASLAWAWAEFSNYIRYQIFLFDILIVLMIVVNQGIFHSRYSQKKEKVFRRD